MPEAILGSDHVVNSVQAAVWGARAGKLLPCGLAVVDEGEWQIPAPDQLATQMNQAIIDYRGTLSVTRDKARRAIHVEHQVQIHFLRLLGTSEMPGVNLRKHGELIFNLFAQGVFPLPGYTRQNGVLIEHCSPSGIEYAEGFLLGDAAEVEHATVTLSVATMNHQV